MIRSIKEFQSQNAPRKIQFTKQKQTTRPQKLSQSLASNNDSKKFTKLKLGQKIFIDLVDIFVDSDAQNFQL